MYFIYFLINILTFKYFCLIYQCFYNNKGILQNEKQYELGSKVSFSKYNSRKRFLLIKT